MYQTVGDITFLKLLFIFFHENAFYFKYVSVSMSVSNSQWGTRGRAAAWWMSKADGAEREACSGRGDVFILQTSFTWVIHVCITHKIYVS